MKPGPKSGTQTKDITGQKFGRWTVLAFTEIRKEKSFFLCRCECGTEKQVSGNSLKTGASKSCGCLHAEQAAINMKCNQVQNRLASGEANFNDLLSRYRRGAKERDLSFDLTIKEFRELTSAECFYCGTEPSQIAHKTNTFGSYLYNGIDRVDNTIGYNISNCVSCCQMCNEWKRAYSKAQFFSHIERIYQKCIQPLSAESKMLGSTQTQIG